MKNIYIGNIIRRKVEESGLSIAEFASRINRTRPTAYDIFSRKSIDVDLLLCISEVLDYNFLKEVYLENEEQGQSDNPVPQKLHYIIGVEVDEQRLQQFTADAEYQVLLKMIGINKG